MASLSSHVAMVTEKSASCYSQEQSSMKIIEKDFRIILRATAGGFPKILTFKDEMTVKAQHRHDQASSDVSGCSAPAHNSSHNVKMHIMLWQNDTQRHSSEENRTKTFCHCNHASTI